MAPPLCLPGTADARTEGRGWDSEIRPDLPSFFAASLRLQRCSLGRPRGQPEAHRGGSRGSEASRVLRARVRRSLSVTLSQGLRFLQTKRSLFPGDSVATRAAGSHPGLPELLSKNARPAGDSGRGEKPTALPAKPLSPGLLNSQRRGNTPGPASVPL